MVFSSLLFLTLFLPVTLFLHDLLPRRYQNALLLAASLIFYAWGEPKHIFLMLLTSLYIWGFALAVEKYRREENFSRAKLLTVTGVVLSLGTLGYFKYFGFLTENLPFLGHFSAPALPIGISFYTFQALSYLIDVYRGTVKAQKSPVNFAMYLSFFPQLIAGPIVRYSDVEQQITRRRITANKRSRGAVRFVTGLAKKVLLANQIGLVWTELSGMNQLSMLGAWLGAVAFAFQIYFDFSAYSDMAIGMGLMFGFRFPENFQYPYQSASVSEFWRRWHITLGSWFREYVYIPLGGNRKGARRQILNLLIVWALTGLWHGAAWQFVLWGLYYFCFLTLEKFVLRPVLEKAPGWLCHLYTLLVVLFGWVIFACPDVETAMGFYRAMLGIGVPLADDAARFALSGNRSLLLILAVGATALPSNLLRSARSRLDPVPLRRVIYAASFLLVFVSLAFLVADSYNPFLYFRV